MLNLTGSITGASTINVGTGGTLTGTGSTAGNISFASGSSVIATATGVQGATVTAAGPVNVYITGTPTGGAATANIVRYTGTTPGLTNFSANAANYRGGSITDTGTAIQLAYTAYADIWAGNDGNHDMG